MQEERRGGMRMRQREADREVSQSSQFGKR